MASSATTLAALAFSSYAVIGVGSEALLWGVVMAILSLVPAVGSALLWVPAAGYLLLSGATGKGIILIAVGIGIAGIVTLALVTAREAVFSGRQAASIRLRSITAKAWWTTARIASLM